MLPGFNRYIDIFDPGQCGYPQMDGPCGDLPHNRCPDQRLDADGSPG